MSQECSCKKQQKHVHEVQGSTRIAEIGEDPHNHRIASVSGQAIPTKSGNHVHKIEARTDFYENHFHLIRVISKGAVKVGNRHVHFVMGTTSVNDGHSHDFIMATFIENQIGD